LVYRAGRDFDVARFEVTKHSTTSDSFGTAASRQIGRTAVESAELGLPFRFSNDGYLQFFEDRGDSVNLMGFDPENSSGQN